MEVVFEVFDHAGRVLERRSLESEALSIGRAYDNDLIISDDTVDPHHATIRLSEQGDFTLDDLASINGIRVNGRSLKGSVNLFSGDEFALGRARIRVFRTDHKITETVKIGGSDSFVVALGTLPLFFVFAMLAIALTTTEIWLNTFSQPQWAVVGLGIFSVFVASAVTAAVFAIIGRIVRQEGRFQTLFVLVLIYLVCQSVIVYLYEVILYNSLSAIPSIIFGLSASFIVLCTSLWVALHIATNLNRVQRWRLAAAITGVFLCISVYPEIIERTEFSESPNYVKEIKPPVLRFSTSVSGQEFLQSTASLYDRTNHED